MSGRREADIVVVGAGAAGLAAAAAARAGGLDVALLEAKDRIGGRAFTDPTGLPSGPFDIGCHWMHDASENPFTAVALATGCGFRNKTHPGRMPHWLALGGRLADAAERHAVADYYADSFEAIRAAGERGEDRPALEVVDAESPHYPLFHGWCAAIMAVPPARLSTLDYATCLDTGENWPVERGYGALIAAAFAGAEVELGCPVRRIDWSGPRLRVETDRGAIEAEDVILAVSSTVLADEAIRIDPGLPDDARAALDAVRLGHAERIGVSLDAKLDGLGDHVAGHILTKAGDEIGLMIHEFGRAELTGYLSGDLARDLGSAGPEAAFAFYRDALTEIFGSGIESRITGWIASQWSGDPDIRGAYSAARPGQAALRARLAEPVDERLHLAGEATHPNRFASAHGAYSSGLRAVSAVRARRKAAGLE